MKLDFKRALSSIMALVMTLSCVSLMSMGVMAATTTTTWNFANVATHNEGTEIAASEGDGKLYVKTKNISSDSDNGLAMKSSLVYMPIKDTTKWIKVTATTPANHTDRALNVGSDAYNLIMNGSDTSVTIKDLTGLYVSESVAGHESQKYIALTPVGDYKVTKIVLEEHDETYPFQSGKVTITKAGEENGTISVTKEDGGDPVNSDETLAGGTKIKITAKATDESNYFASVKINGNEMTLDGEGSCTWIVDSDVTIDIKISALGKMLDIDSTYAWKTGMDTDVLASDTKATSDYHFALTPSASVNSSDGISLSKGSDTQKSVMFKIGTIPEGKTAKLIVCAASGGSNARTLKIAEKSTGSEKFGNAGDLGTTLAGKASGYMEPYNLNSGSEYYITTGGDTVHISQIVILVTDTSKFTFKKAETVGNDVYVIGEISDTNAKDTTNIGFAAAKSAAGVAVNSTDVDIDTVYEQINNNGASIAEKTSGTYYGAIKVEGAAGKSFLVSAYSETDGSKSYDNITEVTTAGTPAA